MFFGIVYVCISRCFIWYVSTLTFLNNLLPHPRILKQKVLWTWIEGGTQSILSRWNRINISLFSSCSQRSNHLCEKTSTSIKNTHLQDQSSLSYICDSLIASRKKISIYIRAMRCNKKDRVTNIVVNNIRSVSRTLANIYDRERCNNS